MQEKKKQKPMKTGDRSQDPGALTPKTTVPIDTSRDSVERHGFGHGHDDRSITVHLARSAVTRTNDLALWAAIRKSTDAISFTRYDDFMTQVFAAFGRNNNAALPGPVQDEIKSVASRRGLPFSGTDPYLLLKSATEVFLAANGAVDTSDADAYFSQAEADAATRTLDGECVTIGDLEFLWDEYRVPSGEGTLIPYLDVIRRRIDGCALQRMGPAAGFEAVSNDAFTIPSFDRVLSDKLFRPYMFELIWSYWQEEGMLVQTMNAIARRFQNIRANGGRDPLANMEISGLFPLSNLLWGYIQDEQHRLSIVRRSFEYDHHYGISLQGKAVPPLNSADSRSKFIEAFHHLLHLSSLFFRQDDDTTVRADGFPLLNALREVHIILSQGAHNQFGDLPSTARQEMLQQQWILARPEFNQFLPTRLSIGYPENWMDRVDAMKSLQGWNDTSVIHFNNLAVFGERILLAIRYGAWAAVNQQPSSAANWARDWRAEIQGYVHAYRAVTGVDLSSTGDSQRIDSTAPSIHLANRYRIPGARI